MRLVKRVSLGILLLSSVGCAAPQFNWPELMSGAMNRGGTYHSTVRYPNGGSTTYTTTLSGTRAYTTSRDYKR